MVGEHVTTQHKLLFVICMKKRKEVKSMGQKMIRWGECRDIIVIEYKKRLKARYEELGE